MNFVTNLSIICLQINLNNDCNFELQANGPLATYLYTVYSQSDSLNIDFMRHAKRTDACNPDDAAVVGSTTGL